jgi:hypothetical protein
MVPWILHGSLDSPKRGISLRAATFSGRSLILSNARSFAMSGAKIVPVENSPAFAEAAISEQLLTTRAFVMTEPSAIM